MAKELEPDECIRHIIIAFRGDHSSPRLVRLSFHEPEIVKAILEQLAPPGEEHLYERLHRKYNCRRWPYFYPNINLEIVDRYYTGVNIDILRDDVEKFLAEMDAASEISNLEFEPSHDSFSISASS